MAEKCTADSNPDRPLLGDSKLGQCVKTKIQKLKNHFGAFGLYNGIFINFLHSLKNDKVFDACFDLETQSWTF